VRQETHRPPTGVLLPRRRVANHVGAGGVLMRRVLFLTCLLLSSSCAFLALRKDIERSKQFAIINGSVQADVRADATIVVVLLRSDTGAAVDSFALERPSKYFFIVPPGDYFVAAFLDADRDFRYDPARERGVWYGAPDRVRVATGERVDGIDISIDAPHAAVLDRALVAPELGRRGIHELPDVNIGTVTTINDPRFTVENGKVGMWQPVEFVLRVGAGIYFLEPYDPDKVPVLFVHGIGGNPAQFAHLVARLDHQHFQPWLLYYPSGGRIDLLGGALIRWMNALHAKHPFARLVIVAHSMGGLVSRSAINQWRQAVGDDQRAVLKVFVTISTPWRGHAAAAAGVNYAPTVVPSWYDMDPHSDFLRGIFATKLPAECRYFLFFSYEGGSALLRGTNDGVVTLMSQLAPAAQEEAVQVRGFAEGHDSILESDAVADALNRALASVLR
jgi:pimeloyl-ACP methyl ester carboxylesterase